MCRGTGGGYIGRFRFAAGVNTLNLTHTKVGPESDGTHGSLGNSNGYNSNCQREGGGGGGGG